jgi:glycosyltransferase involved in cell wall biosynthesis
MPSVSVIIPTYNREKYIERAIRSVQAQDFPNIEIIVVDDGSTDNTSQVVKKIATVDSRISLVVHEKSKGAQVARNTGIRNAKGERIAFLDSDDEWLPGSLSKRLCAVEKQKADVVYSACLSVKYPDTDLKPFYVPPLSGMVYREMLRRPGPMFQSLLVKKSALEKIGYLDESIVSYQEWDTAIQLAKQFTFEFVPEPTFIYYRHQSETISKDALKEASGYEQIFNKYQDDMFSMLKRKEIALHYRNIAKFYGKAGNLKEAHRYLILSFKQWPFGRIYLHLALHILNIIQQQKKRLQGIKSA